MSARSRVLLIIGMPASGKTTFGNWMREAHGWMHLDLELRDCLAANGLPAFWSRRIWELDTASLHSFIQHLLGLDQNTVMTWGLPVDCLGLVEKMVSEGVVAWWFEVDRLAARQIFTARPTIVRDGVSQTGAADPTRFDQQVGSLTSQWAALAIIVGNRVVRTLGPSGNYLRPETIYDRLMRISGLALPP